MKKKNMHLGAYLWSKDITQLIISEVTIDCDQEEIECYTYIGETLVPLRSNLFVNSSDVTSSEDPFISAYRIKVAIDKKAA